MARRRRRGAKRAHTLFPLAGRKRAFLIAIADQLCAAGWRRSVPSTGGIHLCGVRAAIRMDGAPLTEIRMPSRSARDIIRAFSG